MVGNRCPRQLLPCLASTGRQLCTSFSFREHQILTNSSSSWQPLGISAHWPWGLAHTDVNGAQAEGCSSVCCRDVQLNSLMIFYFTLMHEQIIHVTWGWRISSTTTSSSSSSSRSSMSSLALQSCTTLSWAQSHQHGEVGQRRVI